MLLDSRTGRPANDADILAEADRIRARWRLAATDASCSNCGQPQSRHDASLDGSLTFCPDRPGLFKPNNLNS